MKLNSIAHAAVLGGAIAFAALVGSAGHSEAAGIKNLTTLKGQVEHSKVQKTGLKFRKIRRLRLFSLRSGFEGCGLYQWKWRTTGLLMWKRKFFLCQGQWPALY
jgi:hypothetical protein